MIHSSCFSHLDRAARKNHRGPVRLPVVILPEFAGINSITEANRPPPKGVPWRGMVWPACTTSRIRQYRDSSFSVFWFLAGEIVLNMLAEWS
jgi:hypothetical protein